MNAHELNERRRGLLKAVKEMARLRLVTGTNGNASVRTGTGQDVRFLITPSALPYEQMETGDLVEMDVNLESFGTRTPSSESQLHLAIYRARPDVHSVVHTHSLYATALAVAGRPLSPVVDELVMFVGGQVEVADYGFPGSDELARAAVSALGDRGAVLLRNHGVVGVGSSPQDGLRVCQAVERAAEILFVAEMLGGSMKIPSEALAAERSVYLMRAGMKETT